MASIPAHQRLDHAFTLLSSALNRLETAAAANVRLRASFAEHAEALQAELTAGWEARTADLETAHEQATQENVFLKEEHVRLTNQLQALQRDYMALQQTAGSVMKRLDGSISQLDLLLEH